MTIHLIFDDNHVMIINDISSINLNKGYLNIHFQGGTTIYPAVQIKSCSVDS